MRLVQAGHLTHQQLAEATTQRNRSHARLSDILVARGVIHRAEMDRLLAADSGLRSVDLARRPPVARIARSLPAALCLAHGAVPWRRIGSVTVLALAHPDRAEPLRRALPADFGAYHFVFAPDSQVQKAIADAHRGDLAQRAETRCPAEMSCRDWAGPSRAMIRAPALATMALAGLTFPAAAAWVLMAIAVTALLANMTLKTLAALATLRARAAAAGAADAAPPPAIARLPRVSILVPLHREARILPDIIRRLGRLDYPPELLEIRLVIEEDDAVTRAALAATPLPPWMAVTLVPDSRLRTKPRALNYALDFCRGSIVGIYDAEDAPEPDQIRRMVARFHASKPDVACLQGILDFYNARMNWLSRCFAIEYAVWFRMILPGFERLGLPVPLGGTTLFFRRDVLEAIGGWDAHNVTEDADLGMRLARHGYRCEFVPSVTYEEANCRPWAWVRQRSRWLKGFAMTWVSHMRRPARLWSELGPRGFTGFQVLFLGTLAAFLTAPFLWSFWLLALTGTVPFLMHLPDAALVALAALFVVSELVGIAIALAATSGPKHRFLMPWVPSMHLYFPLGALAAWKAVYEIVARPFYWDKTDHGHARPGPGDPMADA
ncbi:glycosyltransferase family 2 protein [Rhodovulum sp. YNF3179]|uniref:glycosyltransferase family 2 protein n=1 Tax=Rhodovulum sp. YNF3179 TaxID=3425127 RepID=UPI003D33D1E5